MTLVGEIPDWLPPGKRAAVCLSIDDVHPATSAHPYEAGGDLGAGALRHVAWLLERHPSLRVTLFTTPDWREIAPLPTRALLGRIPFVRDRAYLGGVWPKGTMRIDRHPAFVRYLCSLPRTEIALHGLHHVHRGLRIPAEFQEQGVPECERILREAMSIFRSAGLPFVPGFAPPAFSTPPALLTAMARSGFTFVNAARDLQTAVSATASCSMSGLHDVALIFPQLVEGGALVHFPVNFQATSTIERAMDVCSAGGLLSIKGHIIKHAMGHVALDGMDEQYREHLHRLFGEIDRRFGSSLWWTSMGEIAARVLGAARTAHG